MSRKRNDPKRIYYDPDCRLKPKRVAAAQEEWLLCFRIICRNRMGSPLFCLSNKSGVNGASVILYPLGNMTQKALQTMVQDINLEVVEIIDQLSDHVYVFRRAVGKLELEAA